MTALLALLALWAVAPAAASAASRDEIIQDCADNGQLDGKYTASELRDARQNLPSDVAEYTDCADVLRRGELPDRGSSAGGGGGGGTGTTGTGPGASGGGTGSSGGGSVNLTPNSEAERQALADVAVKGAGPVEVAGERIVPGAAGFSPDASRNGLPGTLLFAILALALLGIGGLAYAVRDRMPGFGNLIPSRRA